MTDRQAELIAEYSEPVTISKVVCEYCFDVYGGGDCANCMKPKTNIVTVLEFGVGANCDRANIKFADGRIKNVSVNTLKLIRR